MKKLTNRLVFNLGNLWQNKDLSRPIKINLLLTAGQAIFLTINFSRLPPQVPLFYSQPWGEPQLASPGLLFLLPGFSFLFFLLNSTISIFNQDQEENKILGSLLNWNGAWVSLFCLITLLKIITIIT